MALIPAELQNACGRPLHSEIPELYLKLGGTSTAPVTTTVLLIELETNLAVAVSKKYLFC
jgi:hypothetical protein